MKAQALLTVEQFLTAEMEISHSKLIAIQVIQVISPRHLILYIFGRLSTTMWNFCKFSVTGWWNLSTNMQIKTGFTLKYIWVRLHLYGTAVFVQVELVFKLSGWEKTPLIGKEKGICVMGNKTYQRMQDHLLPHNVTAHIYRLLVMAH